MNKILLFQPFQGHYSHCIENSQLICWANQLTGFYMIETLALTKFGPVLFQIETSHLICTTLVSIWKATIGWDGLKWVNCWWWIFLQVFFCFNKHIFWYNTRILLTKISPHRLCKYKMELKEIGNIAYKSISKWNCKCLRATLAIYPEKTSSKLTILTFKNNLTIAFSQINNLTTVNNSATNALGMVCYIQLWLQLQWNTDSLSFNFNISHCTKSAVFHWRFLQ